MTLKINSKKIVSTASRFLRDEKNREMAKKVAVSALKQAKKMKKK